MNKELFYEKYNEIVEKFEQDIQIKSFNICIILLLLVIMGSASAYFFSKNSGVNTTLVHARESMLNKPQTKLEYNDKVGVPILVYHKIATLDKLDGVPANMVVTPEELESQLMYFKNQGYTAISFNELYEFLANKKPIPEKSFIISFDDGYESNYVYLPSMMKKLGMKAEIAVVTGATRKAEGSVSNGASYFTWKHAKEMQKSGLINIESHTANHPDLAKSKILDIELGGSSFDMAKFMNKRPTVIVYPGGSYSSNVIEAAKKHGYKMGVTIEQGLNYPGQDLMKIKRFIISHGETGEEIIWRVNRFSKK